MAFVVAFLLATITFAAEPWAPPEPAADDFDWVQLKSGEWLKGKIQAMQEEKLEIDSEELGDLTFKWKDIKRVRSPHLQQCQYGDRQRTEGTLLIDDKEVTVHGEKQDVRFARADLLGFSPGGPKEINYWSGKISLGANVRGGNTEQQEFTAHFTIQRRTPSSRLLFDYIGNFSRLEGVENANNQRVELDYDLRLTRRIFWRPAFVDYYHDPFQNIAHRALVGTAAGYRIIDTPRTEWELTGGPAFQYTRFGTVAAGQADDDKTPALSVGWRFDTELTKRLDLIQTYEATITSEDAGRVLHHAVTTLDFEITKLFDLDVSFTWDRVQQPQPEADLTIPKQDDFRLTLSLGVKF